jgi:lysophospholipase L1-like esterase
MVQRKSNRRAVIVALAAALLVPLALLVLRPGVSAAAEPVRVMPLGDSITGSPGCWRALLWNRLQGTGYTNVDFVGTLPPQGCGVAYDGDNEGHGGFLATNIANQNLLPGWLSATRPNVVLMHLGTNDVWSNISPTTILTAFGTLVDQMRASNPDMRILVARIIPMNPASCPQCAQRTIDFNAAIPQWAAGKTTTRSPIVVVDQWTGFNTASDTYDGVHPNAAGDQKLSDRWYQPLTAILNGIMPTQPPTPSATPSRTPTAPPTGGGCTATYRIGSQWQGGFQGEVTVTNTRSSALTGWTVRFTFANGQQVTQYWSSELAQSGSAVTARNVNWNGALNPGASTAFGFIANWTGANALPVLSCTAQ